MKRLSTVTLKDVQNVYNGPEGDLWELIMGEQIHIGGFQSSMVLAEKANIGSGMKGVDLCCCNGAGMRFLVRFRNVDGMTGVDASEKVIQRGKERSKAEGFSETLDFKLANVQQTGLPDEQADFVWGEDAWCYVEEKEKLLAEASRLLKPGGTIAFTDWIEGENLSDDEGLRFLKFMKFPNVLTIKEYSSLLEQNGFDIIAAENTDQYSKHIDLYLNMLNMQLTYDGLKIIGFNTDMMAFLAGEMVFMQNLAHQNKIIQGRFIATKK